MSAFTHYRRHLPHFRLAGASYFVTWRLHRQQFPLSHAERSLVQDALKHFDGQRYDLLAYVVMDDHVHVLFGSREGFPVTSILQSWKSFTSKQISRTPGRDNAVWQQEYFDRIVRDESEMLEKAQYILSNPRKRWPELEEYAWCWAIGSEKESSEPG